LNAGPLWDFNLGYGNANYNNSWETNGLQLYANLGDDYWQNPFWWKRMMNDPYFTHPLKCKWELLRENELSNQRIFEVTDSLVNLLTDATIRNFNRWPILDKWIWPNYFVGASYWEETNWLKDWIGERLRWLDFALPGDCGTDPGMPAPDFEFHVYPNPFTTKFTIQILSDVNLTYNFQLFTVNGQKVKDINLQIIKGSNLVEINTSNFRSGVFIYRLKKGNTEVLVGKIVKV
ncbi:MAG: CotH kinase family protein, partial [Bacteroidetes bacterium]|nr:CotH kinase family protein [Bacteroidota bacterium]